jgi:3-oxoacyl-[acyl-carrier protein] reductase
LVTGGQRGIGAAISEALQSAGRKVVASYAGNDAAAEAFTKRTGIPCYKFDVADYDACTEAVKRIEQEVGVIEILVNNAGITRDQLLLRMREEDWDLVLDTNLSSVYRLSKAVLRGMMKAHKGRIVSIASVVGLIGNPGQANYAAAKAGIIAFSNSLAREIGSRGITVNVVAPGFIDTDMTRALAPEARAALLGQIALGKLGQPQDIAAAVGFLASPAAAYITGETLHVNGGMYMA